MNDVQLAAIRARAEKYPAMLDWNDFEALLDEVARLRKIMIDVEWVQDADTGATFCAWCGVNEYLGHYTDCPRQAALGLPPCSP